MPPPAPQLVTGRNFAIHVKAGKPAKTSEALLSKDATITLGGGNGSADDPTLHGGSLRVVGSAAGAFVQSYPLQGGWKYVGKAGKNKGYRWSSKSGPVTSVLVKPKLLKLAGHGSGLDVTLAGNPNPVAVELDLGSHRFCLAFGGTTKFVPGKSYVANNAPAAGACPP